MKNKNVVHQIKIKFYNKEDLFNEKMKNKKENFLQKFTQLVRNHIKSWSLL